ncbi:MAG TPA: ribonuclease P protein component [Burkholderiales bacterium]|nr:ribonuclease P protein component [Burkholderiales bacterium]
MARRQRLDTAAFTVVLRSGRVLRGACAQLLVKANGLDYARLGMIVPKRAVALATRRNRLRRVIREWFRLNQARFAGRDWVVRLNIPARDKSKARQSGPVKPADLVEPLRADLDKLMLSIPAARPKP